MSRVRVAPVAVAVTVAAVATEVVWQLAWRVASPARALLFVICAAAIGNALLGIGARRPRCGLFEAFTAGAIVLALVFAACVRFGAWRAFGPLAYGAAVVALAWRRPTQWLARPIARQWLLVAPFLFVLVVRAAWFTDRLDLTVSHPNGFAWLDTPLWLSLAHGVERAVPPPDLLFAGGTVNYHFGSALIIASMRRLTGMPPHVAYFASMVVFEVALCAGLARIARVFLRASLFPRMCSAVFGLVLIEHVTVNFPSVVAIPMLLFLLLLVQRLARPAQAVPLVVAAFFLMITKEVEYLLFFVLASAVAVVRYWKRRRS